MKGFARTLCATLLTCLLLSLLASAQHTGKGSSKDKDGNDETVVATAGQQAAVDKSGKLRQPTPEEVQTLTAPLQNNDSTDGLKAVVLDNGAVKVDLEGRFESTLMVKKNADGTLTQGCVQTPKQARDFLTGDTTKQAAPASKKPAQKPVQQNNSALEDK